MIRFVHQFKLYLKEDKPIRYALRLSQSVKCVLEHQIAKRDKESLLVPDDDDDTYDTRVFMPQNDPYAVPKHMRQEMKGKAKAQKPKNIVNNNSVAQETSIEEVSTETVQDTQTQN